MIISELSELIIENCLYCDGTFTIEGTGEHAIPRAGYFVDIYTCTQCFEMFEIHMSDDKRESFFFSCDDIYARCFATWFVISTDERLQYKKFGIIAPSVKIPPFPIDFSDKQKLHSKLKTYIIFS